MHACDPPGTPPHLAALTQAKVSTPSKICCSVKDWERRDALERLGIGSIFGDATESGAEEVARFARIVFLCTKVQVSEVGGGRLLTWSGVQAAWQLMEAR